MEQRRPFIAFLHDFANGEIDPGDWNRLVVNHYLDDVLEEVRRNCVRIRIENPDMKWSDEQRSRIHDWIRELGAAG